MIQATFTYGALDYNPQPAQDELSDSDWLEIPSGDDSDSIGGDSDHHDGRALSRRSSFSIDSHGDGDVGVWSSDEEDQVSPHDAISQQATASLGLEVDSVEERRVCDALDQSMIGTLNSSHSSYPPTVQNSVRDLRLSFPDPLTSSHDGLNGSFEAISTSDETSASTGDDMGSTVAHAPVTAQVDRPPSSAPVAPVSFGIAVSTTALPSDLDIVLYGSSHKRWSIAEDVLRKSSTRSAWTVTHSLDGMVRWLSQGGMTYAIRDKTEGAENTTIQPSSLLSNRPSLAIIYLPSSSLDIAEHSLYLPIFISRDNDTDEEFTRAQEQWDLLTIPSAQVLPIADDLATPLPEHDLAVTDARRVHDAFARLLELPHSQLPVKKRTLKGLSLEQFSSIHAVTIFALLSIIAGFVVNTTYRAPPPPPTPTAKASNVWTLIGSNDSTAVALRASNSMSVLSAPGSHLPAAYTRGSTSGSASLSKRAQRSGGTCFDGATASCLSHVPTWSQTSASSAGSSTMEVSVRPPATLAEVTTTNSIIAPVTQPTGTIPTGTSLSLRVIDSLSEIVEATTKALMVVVQNEFKELSDAIDLLLSSIRVQVDNVVKESKSAAQTLRDQLQYRHNRAKGKARQFMAKSDSLFVYASDSVKGRTAKAKAKASVIKDSFVNSDAWVSYKHSHSQWVERLKGRDQETHNLRKRSSGRRRGTMTVKRSATASTRTGFRFTRY